MQDSVPGPLHELILLGHHGIIDVVVYPGNRVIPIRGGRILARCQVGLGIRPQDMSRPDTASPMLHPAMFKCAWISARDSSARHSPAEGMVRFHAPTRSLFSGQGRIDWIFFDDDMEMSCSHGIAETEKIQPVVVIEDLDKVVGWSVLGRALSWFPGHNNQRIR